MLRIDKKKGRNSIEEWEANDRIYEPKNDIILQTVAKLLVPPIMIFGIYVILCGHLGPGGGFSGGAVIGAGLILYLNAFGFAKTERFFTAKTYKWMSFGALACYALAKKLFLLYRSERYSQHHSAWDAGGDLIERADPASEHLCRHRGGRYDVYVLCHVPKGRLLI